MKQRQYSRLLVLAAAIVAVLGLCAAPPVRAEDTITTQPYVDFLNLRALDDLGLSGEGVTIALIDAAVDLSAPELQGADITSVSPCTFTPAPKSITHGTAVASILVSPDYGIAPGAKVIHYAIPMWLSDTQAEKDIVDDPSCTFSVGHALQRALDDGADIISYSVAEGSRVNSGAELARADVAGAIVVAAVGNDNQETDPTSFAATNLTIGVAATDAKGVRSEYSNYGKGTTIAAYGGPVSIRRYETGTISDDAKGTSFAAPMVSGMLALAKEKWPEATNRQLIQSLVRTASRDDGVEWDPWYGYGLVNINGLLNEDPTALPNVNPLVNKSEDWVPSEEFYHEYLDGLVDPGDYIINDPQYVYRGTSSAYVAANPDKKTAYGTSPRYHRDEK
ncbi:S8 family serine peptidase [Schaalia hyovaginalis]|uniref:Subtilisin family serine protease n=1 Tax=Schaalia hyovaginalis TaxID=29316 RepID=A0A923E106_9ACTO|nr:S8 family serine peptidase [Schaalia hyovaginalis]MBB6333956.1 subtilisin family serine protease [Schaalia hyovaginalis]MDY2669011.1 S8 family serine peptidase [Schaalia hyovaginalis]